MSIQFIQAPRGITGAVIGDNVSSALGGLTQSWGALVWNVDDQPANSNLFDGLGTAGDDVPHTDATAAEFTHSGVHGFTITTDNGVRATLTIVVWPTEALDVDQIHYSTRPHYSTNQAGAQVLTSSPEIRQTNDRRAILRSLAQHVNVETAATVLENAPAAPYYGTLPSTLGAPGTLTSFGATW